MGFIENRDYGDGSPSLYLTNTKGHYISFSIEAPGVGYSFNGAIKPYGLAVVNLSTAVLCDTYHDQNNGVYLQSNSSDMIVIGQNKNSRNGDTFLALPYEKPCFTEYVYYGISTASRYRNVILVVGTEDNTTMALTVPQSVTVKIDFVYTRLARNIQYSFIINRLQTVYIATTNDLTGTKIATDKPVSVTSGNECAFQPSDYSYCAQLLEQIPATVYWGKVYYTIPFTISEYYALQVLAAHDDTAVHIYCDNVLRYDNTIDEGRCTLLSKQSGNCVIQSNREILVTQISQSYGYYERYYSGWSYRTRLVHTEDDPMFTTVPATVHYSNEIFFSTSISQSTSYDNCVNIVVLAEYFQPSMIYLDANGYRKQLDSVTWRPIRQNSRIVAYGTQLTVTEGSGRLIHTNATDAAPMTAVVYGQNNAPSYGHPSAFYIQKHSLGMYQDSR